MISLTAVTPPAVEPIPLSEAQAQTRVDITDDNALLAAYIAAARQRCELAARRSFITQTWKLTLDAWPLDGVFRLPRPPLQSVTSIVYTDDDGTSATWASSNYIVDTAGSRIVVKSDATWPAVTLREAAAIAVTYVAGYGDSPSDVPRIYRQAVMLTLAHFYENREAIHLGQGFTAVELPIGIRDLLTIDRGSFGGLS